MHDLVEVVVGLVDDLLPVRAVAALEQVVDPFELGGRAEVLRVLAEAVVEPLRASALVGTRSKDGRSTISPSSPWRAAIQRFSSSISYG